MTEQQKEAYRLMIKALKKALDEIHNPGFNRTCGLDIAGHIEQTIDHATKVGPEDL